MSMSFGGGDPYAALVQALMQRRQQQGQGQQMAPQQAMGGTMQSQPAQMPQMAAQPGNAMAGAMAGMPSAQSLAGLLKQAQGAWSPQGGVKAGMESTVGGEKAAMDPGAWSRFTSMFGSGS